MHRFLVILALLSAPSLRAQVVDYERILFPIMSKPTQGAFGSLFVTNLRVLNASSSRVEVSPLFYGPPCQLPTCAFPSLPPNEVMDPRVEGIAEPGTPPGLIGYVAKSDSSKISFTLRIQDTSRQALTWGTEVPVIRENEFLTARSHLLNIPLDVRFRQAVRFYDPDGMAGAQILVRAYSKNAALSGPDVPAGEITLSFQGPSCSGGCVFNEKPAYAQLTSLVDTFPLLRGSEYVRLDVVPLTVGLRYWVFASITNNETQHITVITPQ